MKTQNCNCTARHSIPRRCDKPAAWYSPVNGYRACRDHEAPGLLSCAEAGPEPFGPCDYPMDGMGAARYQAACGSKR